MTEEARLEDIEPIPIGVHNVHAGVVFDTTKKATTTTEDVDAELSDRFAAEVSSSLRPIRLPSPTPKPKTTTEEQPVQHARPALIKKLPIKPIQVRHALQYSELSNLYLHAYFEILSFEIGPPGFRRDGT